MDTTIDKAERLTHYLKAQHRKSDAVIDPVLDKLLDQERQSLLKQRAELRSELDQFERQYGLDSPEFCAKFERGEMFSEYVVLNGGLLTERQYSFQWQDANNRLIRRWDNAKHFGQLPYAPHHIHHAGGTVEGNPAEPSRR